ncbi:MAG TPA: HlyD family secretion protein, partial [Thermoanaerobaculia bacterium]|nr:HlyD family secretion protein [Thermoanaerobaculia bacterium]
MDSSRAPAPRAPKPADEAPAPPPAPKAKSRAGRFVLLGILVVGIIAGGTWGWREISFYRIHVETDDAQVEAHIDPVLPKIAGYVQRVLVDDNQRVRQGDLLLTIDARDYRARAATSAADLQNARAAVVVARSTVQAAQTNRAKTAADLQRYAALRQKEEVSQQQYDAAKAAADAAEAQVQAELGQVSAAEAKVRQKESDLDYARLQESYGEVTAPSTGTVSRKNVEVGQYVQAGQPLLAIVSDEQPWIVANFKETQLKKMRVGQPVTIEVDAYPKRPFRAKVQSIAAATGA